MIQMTYQKANGEIIQRIVNTYTPYNIGDTTSMGWYVKDKRYRYKNKYYSRADYDALIDKSCRWHKKAFKIKNTLYNVYKELVYCIILLISIRFFEITTRLVV